MTETNTLLGLLDLDDNEVFDKYTTWECNDCSLFGLTKIYQFQLAKGAKLIDGNHFDPNEFDNILDPFRIIKSNRQPPPGPPTISVTGILFSKETKDSIRLGEDYITFMKGYDYANGQGKNMIIYSNDI